MWWFTNLVFFSLSSVVVYKSFQPFIPYPWHEFLQRMVFLCFVTFSINVLVRIFYRLTLFLRLAVFLCFVFLLWRWPLFHAYGPHYFSYYFGFLKAEKSVFFFLLAFCCAIFFLYFKTYGNFLKAFFIFFFLLFGAGFWVFFFTFYLDVVPSPCPVNSHGKESLRAFFLTNNAGCHTSLVPRLPLYGTYFRDIMVDTKEHAAYICLSTTLLGSHKKKAVLLRFPERSVKKFSRFYAWGIKSFFVGHQKLYAADWQNGVFYILYKKNLHITRTFSLKSPYNDPIGMIVHEDKKEIALLFDVYPAVKVYQLPSFKELKSVRFIKEGAGLGSGADLILFSPKRNRYYVLLYGGRYHLYELDAQNLKVLKKLSLPDEGVGFALDEERNLLYLSTLFTNEVYVLDLKTYHIVRKFTMPSVCRRMIVDESRNLLYALNYTLGELYFVNLKTGHIAKTYKVGNKPIGLYFSKDTSTLYAASTSGIFKILLGKHL